MRTVATICVQDESKALRAAARLNQEKPAGSELQWLGRVGKFADQHFHMVLKAPNGVEPQVQEFLRRTVRQIPGHIRTKFDLG